MDQRSVEERLRRIIAERCGADESQKERRASFEEKLSADSLDVVELIMSLEEDFGIEFGDDDWLQGTGVPRRTIPPSDSGAAGAPLRPDVRDS